MMNTSAFHLKTGQAIRQHDVLEWLHQSHYIRVEQVTFFGDYAKTGDRIIVHPVNAILPIIIDFLGDEIEALYTLHSDGEKTPLATIAIGANIVDADGLRFEPGQYVVHLDHGIGQFKTLGLRETGSLQTVGEITPYTADEETLQKGHVAWAPYLILEYADGAELYVPPNQAHKLTHYIGSRRPVLSKLGSRRWQVTKKKVEEDLFKLAKDLLTVAAQRELHERDPLPIQLDWVTQLANEFPYDETDDQQKAISAVLGDLQSRKPMDRLICGDVGFGKTEVAVRAAAAVASTGRQVAILAPTTLLASQHGATFHIRLRGLPVRLGVLSRFAKEEERQQILQELAEGKIDIVIGTHSLLQPSVQFKDLGLLIIDEEQKFGVKHKEYLKKARAAVDVLTLSATPIPRTLFSGLSGLRDISLILTPPKNRKAIATKVMKTDDQVITKAIETEVARDGQVFILHNDVVTIEARARAIRALVPTARVEVAHGQMPEQRLSETMRQMIEGEIDVLITSTIIESGLDMPNVNTLIVEKADHFGLSDLYQLRGRIGRSDAQAYAYFFYDTAGLTGTAEQRFRALQESDTLGSGYSIALRDLEIRGGGNVLGRQQHGNMEAIGLSLYAKLLKLTVEKLRQS